LKKLSGANLHNSVNSLIQVAQLPGQLTMDLPTGEVYFSSAEGLEVYLAPTELRTLQSFERLAQRAEVSVSIED